MNCSPYLRLVHDYSSIPRGQSFQGTYRNEHVIHYFKSGHGRYRYVGGEVSIVPGLVALHRPGDSWAFKFAYEGPFHMLNIIFDVVERTDSYLPFPYPVQDQRPQLESLECLEGPTVRLPTVQLLLVPSEFENHFAELQAVMGQETVQARLRRKAIFLEILALLYRNAGESYGDVSVSHERVLAEAVALLRDQVECASPITLQQLATQLALSRSLIYRIFQDHIGIPPMKYLMRLKIERAQVEMILHLRSIKDTADLLGFASVHHFTRVFRQHTGCPPGQFLRRHLSK